MSPKWIFVFFFSLAAIVAQNPAFFLSFLFNLKLKISDEMKVWKIIKKTKNCIPNIFGLLILWQLEQHSKLSLPNIFFANHKEGVGCIDGFALTKSNKRQIWCRVDFAITVFIISKRKKNLYKLQTLGF